MVRAVPVAAVVPVTRTSGLVNTSSSAWSGHSPAIQVSALYTDRQDAAEPLPVAISASTSTNVRMSDS